MAMRTQPTDAFVDSLISQVEVEVLDAGGVLASEARDSVSVSLVIPPGGGGRGELSGTLKVAASSGVATFSDLSITPGGADYALAFSADGLTGVVSDSFDINAGIQLSIKTQPVLNTYLGNLLSLIEVEIFGCYGQS